MTRSLTLTLFIPVLTLCVSLRAAEDARPALLSAPKLIQAGKSVTREAYPNSDDVAVDYYTRIHYTTNGTCVRVVDRCFKALTEKGKRENREISFHYDLSYGTAIVERLEIIKPDGTIVPIDIARQSRHMISRSQMGSNIYNPKRKNLKVSLPGLEIGDMCRCVSRHVTWKARVPDTWSDYTLFEYTSPIKHEIYEVFGPTNLPLVHTAVKAEVAGAVTSSFQQMGSTNHYHWEVNNVPRMYEEPNMPDLHTVVQRLLVSTIPDWETVSRWYDELCAPRLATVTPAMSNKVAEIIEGLTDREDKIRAIFRYVSQKIRYMGITTEDEAPGYEPHDVNLTFENKYGVCRDKAALLAAMLQLAGFKAAPVLIYAGPKKDEEVPQPYFNHAVSCVENADGSYTLMDSTDENTKEIFPAYLCDKSYIVAKSEGDVLRTSPIVPAEENMLRIETHGSLDKKGDLTAESVIRFEGINDNAYRGYFAKLKPEERKRMFEGRVKRVVAGARLDDLVILPEDMLDKSTALTVRLKYHAKGILVGGEKNTMLPPLWLGNTFGIVNFIIGKTGLDERQYPFKTDVACGVTESFRLDLDDAVGKTVALPSCPAIETSNLTWVVEVARTGTLLTGTSDFRINVVEFSTNGYLELKDALKKMEYDRRKRAIFETAPALAEQRAQTAYPDADIVLLKKSVTYDVKDEHTVKITSDVKKKILTYAGKKKNSELKIDYNPVWDEVKIEKATVTAKDGTVQELSDDELNLMDAAWVGSAPRYPAAKTLVASLPGVDIGSVVEYRVVRTAKDRPFLAFNEYFRGFEPIEEKTVTLSAPKSLRLRLTDAPGGAVDVVQSAANDRVIYTWTITDQTDVVKPETSLPPWWYFNPGVIVSAGNWREYALDVSNALVSAAANQDAAAEKAVEITKGADTDAEKVIAIRDFAAENIRPAGPSLAALPLSAITPADTTLSEGYGNNADRAVLLYSMLDAAGLAPEFVLGSWQPRIELLDNPLLEYPQRSVFSDALVRISVDGEAMYLNDTDQYAELGTTWHDGRPGLVIKTGSIEPIRAAAGKENRGDVTYTVTLTEDGNAEITKTREIYGTGFSAFHQRFAEMPPEERRRYHLEMVAAISQSAKTSSVLVTKYDAYPGVEKFSVTVDKYAVRDGSRLYFTVPSGSASLSGLSSDTRENPLYWSDRARGTVTSVVTFPENFKMVELAPPNFHWRAPENAGDIALRTERDTAKANLISVVRNVDLRPAIIPANRYEKLLETNRKLSHPDKQTVLVSEE